MRSYITRRLSYGAISLFLLSISIFLTLAALLVLGAPLTRRRMRLAGRPRWLAPFVLIPDTPG